MSIAFANLGASADPDINWPVDLASYITGSWTPPTSDLIFVYVYNRAVTGTTNQPTISGNGITWTAIATKYNTGDRQRLTLYGANGTGSSNGVTTVDCAGQTQGSLIAAFATATGVDLSAGVTAAFVQLPTNEGTGTTGQVDLAAISASGNRCISGFWHWNNEASTPSATWTELDDLSGITQDRSVVTQYRNVAETTHATATWATSTPLWLGIAAELKEYIAPAPRELRRHIVKSQAVHRASRW